MLQVPGFLPNQTFKTAVHVRQKKKRITDNTISDMHVNLYIWHTTFSPTSFTTTVIFLAVSIHSFSSNAVLSFPVFIHCVIHITSQFSQKYLHRLCSVSHTSQIPICSFFPMSHTDNCAVGLKPPVVPCVYVCMLCASSQEKPLPRLPLKHFTYILWIPLHSLSSFYIFLPLLSPTDFIAVNLTFSCPTLNPLCFCLSFSIQTHFVSAQMVGGSI